MITNFKSKKRNRVEDIFLPMSQDQMVDFRVSRSVKRTVCEMHSKCVALEKQTEQVMPEMMMVFAVAALTDASYKELILI